MNYHSPKIDERVAEIMEISESAIQEIASNIAANCDVSSMEEDRKIAILEILVRHVQKGILASIRELGPRQMTAANDN